MLPVLLLQDYMYHHKDIPIREKCTAVFYYHCYGGETGITGTKEPDVHISVVEMLHADLLM